VLGGGFLLPRRTRFGPTYRSLAADRGVMTMRAVRGLALGLTAGALALAAGTPALAAEPAAEAPVSLIVGLRSGGDVVGRLDKSVDVVSSAAQPGALTVDVPADQVSEAAAVLRTDPAVAYVELDHVARISVTTPDDPGYGDQWGIARTGVNRAWDTTRGSRDVVIAVVDTGVKALPDLSGRLLPGHDFVNNDSNADDDQGHGTMTAGVIAAAGDNGVGIAGVCWTCRILPVKVLGPSGAGSYSDIAEGVRWAADQGADIINLSLGGGSDSQLLRDAVSYATGQGAMVIAAAGNNGSSAPHYPAAIPSVLAVGGSTSGDARYPWSNYGSTWVDIAGPGCNPAQARNGLVGQFCGTSSATPFLSGVAGLLASTSPSPSAATIRAALTSSADKLAGNWVAASSGRVNAAAALAALPAAEDHQAPATSFRSPPGSALVRGTVLVTANASDDVGVASVQLLADGQVVGTDRVAPYSFAWKTTGRGASATLELRTTDRGGNVATATRRVTVDNWGPTVQVSGASGRIRGTRTVRYVTAQAADRNGVSRVEVLVNGKIIQRYAGSKFRFAVATWRYGRVLSVQVRAYDKAGNARSAPARKWYR